MISTDLIIVAINNNYTACCKDEIVYLYNNVSQIDIIRNIFKYDVIKITSKHPSLIEDIISGPCNNCYYIGDIITNRRVRCLINNEIIEQGYHPKLDKRAIKIALIMKKYLTDECPPIFNKKRNNYLLYLTACNNILSLKGPLTYKEIIERLSQYSYLKEINPETTIKALIKAGSLKENSNLIMLPDQEIK